MRPRPLSRRAVLAGGAAAVALSGCTAGDPPPPAVEPPDPEQVLLTALIAEKERTIGLYTSLIAAGGERLAPFKERHEAHVRELRRRQPPNSSPTPTAPAPGTPTPGTPTPAASPAKVSLGRLRDTERRAAASRPRQLSEVSPSLAQLLASIGACEAAHALALPRSL